MKHKWTLPIRLVTLTTAAQMLPAVDHFMQVMATNMAKMNKAWLPHP